MNRNKIEKYRDVIDNLKKEGLVEVSDEVLGKFIMNAEEIQIKRNQVLVEEGEVNDNVYVVRSGVIRYCYKRDGRDVTTYFAMASTPVVCYHCFVLGYPAFYRLEACTKTILLKIKKKDVENLILESHEFSRWMIGIHQFQLFFLEHKDRVITGRASDRLISLFRNRPELLRAVSSKVIASYLGVTESYLSRLKHKLYREGRFNSSDNSIE